MDFIVEKLDPALRADPLTFSLAGQDFTARPKLPGWLLLKFVARTTSDKRGADAGALFDFFRDVLQPESLERFETLVTGDEYDVEMETLGDISSWLIQEYTERPTQPPSSSMNGAGTTSTSSEESAASAESTSTD